MLSWFGGFQYKTLFQFFVGTFETLPTTEISANNAMIILIKAFLVFVTAVCPVFIAAYLLAVVCEISQVGFLLTTKPLAPDINRINPISGFKRIFSKKSVVEVIKSMTKVSIVGYFAYSVVRDNMPQVLGTIKESPYFTFALTGDLVIQIAKKVAMAMVAIAGLDYIYQKYEFEKSLKMSKQEVKDEYKQSEGDPHIKGKQRQKMRQMAMGGVQQAVPESTAVVTNPTHFAIAIKYEMGMKAPIVKAKGEGAVAIYIKKLALEHDIPMFEDVKLARALYATAEIDQEIPGEFFVAVAQIVAEVFKAKNKAKKRASAMAKPSAGSALPMFPTLSPEHLPTAPAAPSVAAGPGAGREGP